MAGEEDYGSARITIVLDDSGAAADARALADRIERALTRGTRNIGRQIRRNIQQGINAAGAVTVRVEPDMRRFNTALRGLNGLGPIGLALVPDLTGFMDRVRAALAGQEVSLRVVPDLSDFDRRIRGHRPPDVTVRVNTRNTGDTDRLSRILGALGGIAARTARALGGLLVVGAVGIAAANTAASIGGLLAALGPLTGILSAFPAAVTGFAVALGTLRLAVVGVGDALKAAFGDDAAAADKALEKLAPAARTAVTAVRQLAPQLKALQQSVQQAFFKQFAGDVSAAIKNLLPLRTQLAGLAGEFGKAADQGLKFAASQQAVAPLRQIIQGTTQAASGLQQVIAPLAKGFLDVAAAVSTAFGQQLGDSIASIGARIGTALSASAASGAAVDRVRDALAVFRQLGDVAQNVGKIVSGMFRAADQAGGGFLANLQTITKSFAQFVNSARGQEAIRGLFQGVAAMAAQLGPILSALVTQIGAIAPALAPVFTALGPAIVGVINALGPAIQAIVPSLQVVAQALAQAFAAIGPSLGPLGAAIGQIVTALAPLLPLVGQLVATLGTALAPVLATLAQAFAPIIAALVGALMPVLPPLAAAFVQLVTAITPLAVGIGQALAQLLVGLAPVLTTLTAAVVQIVTAFAPLITQIVSALMPILPPLISAFLALVQAVMPIIPPVAQLVASLAPLVATVVSLAAPILRVAAAIAGWVVINTVVPLVTGIVSALRGLVGMVTTVVSVVTGFGSRVISVFRTLYSTVVSVVSGLVSGIAGWFRQLPGRVMGAISGLVSSVAGVFRSAGSAALGAVRSMISNVVSTLRGLIGKAKGALSGAGSALVGAGKDLIRGMVNGISSMAGSIASKAKSVVSGAISAAKGALGINSPSKVFAGIGRDTGRGFIVGLTGTASQIQQTTDRVARSITNAFRGRATNVDDRLVSMLQAGNKRLQTLATQRDALAKRIADAQKLAADTTSSALQAFSLQSLTQDEAGGITGDVITRGLKSAVSQVKKYTAQINALAKRGLRKDLLQQLIGLGPQQGAELARVLSKADKATFKRINDLQGQLASASGRLGKTSADAMFDAGKDAGRGFLAGLQGQRRQIEKLMLDIARSMQRAIRSALRIKSPSRVFMKIGDQTGAGLQIGLVNRITALERASRAAARSAVDAVSSQFEGLPGRLGASLGGVAVASSGLVVPLTRAQRARQRADQTERTGAAGGSRRAGTGMVNNFHIYEAGDGHVTAHRVTTRLALAAGVI
ncbi:hypothetical protein ACFV27_01050 [Streptomyces antimycoticus]|uniref:phage tail protein n=1 Tax=Streptomyces antimycoticus TaxID=68175 RepID=UPI00367A25D5